MLCFVPAVGKTRQRRGRNSRHSLSGCCVVTTPLFGDKRLLTNHNWMLKNVPLLVQSSGPSVKLQVCGELLH
eukprot:Skav222109  [mRNA]  locus=scaffold1181:185678:185893:+ [translate_table: standard]